MKVLVFSDSHGVTRYMQEAVNREAPDMVLHLGDVMRDIRTFAKENPGMRVDYVCGNCDGFGAEPEEKLITLNGYRVFLTHGHAYHVKAGVGLAVRTAMEQGADILLFGHTHEPLVDRYGSLWMMNPGSIRGFGKTTYGILTLDQEKVNCTIAVI